MSRNLNGNIFKKGSRGEVQSIQRYGIQTPIDECRLSVPVRGAPVGLVVSWEESTGPCVSQTVVKGSSQWGTWEKQRELGINWIQQKGDGSSPDQGQHHLSFRESSVEQFCMCAFKKEGSEEHSSLLHCLLVIALVRYHLHKVKFTCFRVEFNYFQVNLCLCNHHHNSLLEHLHHSRKFLCAYLQLFFTSTPPPGVGNH